LNEWRRCVRKKASGLRVVLDTNVLVSALLYEGKVRELVWQFLVGGGEVVLSEYILGELRGEDLEVPLRDVDDHPVVETAVVGEAGHIVTGDKELLGLGEWRRIKVLSVGEFGELLGGRGGRS